MLQIHKNYVLDENQQPIAVQISIAEFEKIEAILEDYGLAKLMEEVQNEKPLSKDEAIAIAPLCPIIAIKKRDRTRSTRQQICNRI